MHTHTHTHTLMYIHIHIHTHTHTHARARNRHTQLTHACLLGLKADSGISAGGGRVAEAQVRVDAVHRERRAGVQRLLPPALALAFALKVRVPNRNTVYYETALASKPAATAARKSYWIQLSVGHSVSSSESVSQSVSQPVS